MPRYPEDSINPITPPLPVRTNMEIFKKSEAVKLRSHLDKYLVADDDRQTVRQSRNSGSTNRAIWLIEYCTKPGTVRLKNHNTGLYLTASDVPFLLGMTGKKVLQSSILNQRNDFVSDPSTFEWFPIRDGFQVKFKTHEGKFLRANGGTPPWRNSVTHDVPVAGGTYNWLLWDVVAVDLNDAAVNNGANGEFGDWINDKFSPMSSFAGSEVDDDFVFGTGAVASPVPGRLLCSFGSPSLSMKKSAMDLFHDAKLVRLRSHHHKYLLAEDDEESVSQDRNGSAKNSRWSVEFGDTADNIIRLKSCYGKYLTASNQPFLLGMTGRKVFQTLPTRLDSSVEWEPIREGSQVKLKTRYGNFLRANGGLPPWRNSVTHDVPHRAATQDWVLWDVEIVQIEEHSDQRNWKEIAAATAEVAPVKLRQEVVHYDSFSSETSSPSLDSDRFISSRQESNVSESYSPPKSGGRLIYYHIAYGDHDVDDANEEGYSFTFKGSSVKELTHKLEEETKLEDIYVCTRSPLNGKLYPLRLRLPPNSTTMHVFVVPPFSVLASDVAKMGII